MLKGQGVAQGRSIIWFCFTDGTFETEMYELDGHWFVVLQLMSYRVSSIDALLVQSITMVHYKYGTQHGVHVLLYDKTLELNMRQIYR